MPAAPRIENIGGSPIGVDANETAGRQSGISGGDEQDERVSVAVGSIGGEASGGAGDEGRESDDQRQGAGGGRGVTQKREPADDREVSAASRRASR
jgi:hypothetical protein